MLIDASLPLLMQNLTDYGERCSPRLGLDDFYKFPDRVETAWTELLLFPSIPITNY